MEQKRILLAENEPEAARFIENALKNFNLVVETVADGNEAWALLQTGNYDLLICDEDLPGINGRDLAEMANKIRYEPQHVNMWIIFIVGERPETDMTFGSVYLYDFLVERHLLSDIALYVQKVLATNTMNQKYIL